MRPNCGALIHNDRFCDRPNRPTAGHVGSALRKRAKRPRQSWEAGQVNQIRFSRVRRMHRPSFLCTCEIIAFPCFPHNCTEAPATRATRAGSAVPSPSGAPVGRRRWTGKEGVGSTQMEHRRLLERCLPLPTRGPETWAISAFG